MEDFKRISFSTIIFILYIAGPPLLSGSGVMTSDPDLIISQPLQRILIAFNGEEEVLVLSNVLVGNKSERVLRFIPLPAKPQVRIYDEDIFAHTANLLKSYHHQFNYCYRDDHKPNKVSGIQALQYPQTTPEEISVLEVNDINHFTGLLDEYIVTGNLSLNSSVVEDYISRGFRFFVFDTAVVHQEGQLIQPVVYRFQTNSLFYPLGTLNSLKHEGNLEIYVFSTQRKLADDISLYLPFCRNCKDVFACEISKSDLSQFPSILATFFSERVFFKVYKYWGNFDFKKDIEIKFDKKTQNFKKNIQAGSDDTDEAELSIPPTNGITTSPPDEKKKNQKKQIVTGSKKNASKKM